MNNFAFIDSQNLNLSIAELGWKIDWHRLRVYLKEKYGVQKAYLFLGFLEQLRKEPRKDETLKGAIRGDSNNSIPDP